MSANSCKFWLTLQFFHSPCFFFFACASFPWMSVICTKHKKRRKKITSQNHVGQPDLLIAHVGNSQTDWLKDLIVMMFSTSGIVMLGLWPTFAGYSSQKTNSHGSAPAVCRCQQLRHHEQCRNRQGRVCSLMPWLKFLALLCFGTSFTKQLIRWKVVYLVLLRLNLE